MHPLEGKEGGLLADLLTALMEPYQRSGAKAVHIDAGALKIGQIAATPVALIFHELATNATKYGALSGDTGSVQITARQSGDDAEIRWVESGSPAVSAPETEGFGSRLMQSSASSQLGGSILFDWREKGLEVVLRMPLERLNA